MKENQGCAMAAISTIGLPILCFLMLGGVIPETYCYWILGIWVPFVIISWIFASKDMKIAEEKAKEKHEQEIEQFNKTDDDDEKVCKPTRRVEVDWWIIEFDDVHRTWQVQSKKNWTIGKVDTYDKYIFDYDDVYGIELREVDLGEKANMASVTTRALLGGAIAGDAGAIIGAASSKTKQYARDVDFVIQLNRRSMPEVVLHLLKDKWEKNSPVYQDAIQQAQKLQTGFRLMNAKD